MTNHCNSFYRAPCRNPKAALSAEDLRLPNRRVEREVSGPRVAGVAILVAAFGLATTGAAQVVRAAYLGDTADGRFGHAVARGGDMDADGRTDLLIGAPGTAETVGYGGRLHIQYGDGRHGTMKLLPEYGGELLGWSVAEVGNIDQDIYNEVAVGAPGHDGGRGAMIVFSYPGYGGTDISQTLLGSTTSTRGGTAVAGPGDVDGDGKPDFLDGFGPGGDGGAELWKLGPLTLGWRLGGTPPPGQVPGEGPFARFGFSVAGAGNADGVRGADVVVGAPGLADAFGAPVYGEVEIFDDQGTHLGGVRSPRPGDLFGWSVAGIGDLDGDGRDDIAVGAPLDPRGGPFAGSVTVLVGTGSVERFVVYGAANERFGYSVAGAGDVDGDGVGDIVAGAPFATDGTLSECGLVTVISGETGQTLFRFHGTTAHERLGWSVCGAGDLDNDGYSEVLAGAPFRDVGALPRAGAAYVLSLAGPSNLVRACALVYADGDPYLDVVTGRSGRIAVHRGDGLGGLLPELLYDLPISGLLDVVVAADRDSGSRRDDLIAASSSADVLVRWEGGPYGAFSTTAIVQSSPGPFPSVVCTDLNGDGRDEIVFGWEGDVIPGRAGGLAVLSNDAIARPVWINSGSQRIASLCAADFDDDGSVDVAAIARGNPDELLFFRGTDQGRLSQQGLRISLPVGATATALRAIDADGDGRADLVLGVSTLFPTPAALVRILRRTGAWTFAAPIDVPTGGVLVADLACGELDPVVVRGAVGRLDVAVVHHDARGAVLLRDFDPLSGGFASVGPIVTGSRAASVAIGDLDGDGLDDLVVAHQDGSTPTVIRSIGVLGPVTAYGSGCPGSAGVPAIAAQGMPTLGNTAFAISATGCLSSTIALLWISAEPTVVNFPPGPCQLLVQGLLDARVRLTSGAGTVVEPVPIPADPTIVGRSAYFQWGVLDPGGALAQGAALSAALRVEVIP